MEEKSAAQFAADFPYAEGGNGGPEYGILRKRREGECGF